MQSVIKTGDMGYCFAEPTIEVTRSGEKNLLYSEMSINFESR
jgi:(2Fe-2S) ferredoxin